MKYAQYDCKVSGQCWRDTWMVDYGPLEDCFEGKVRPSDIDMIVERKGHALIFEFKEYGGAEVHLAHLLMLSTLAKAPNTTVIVLYLDRQQDVTTVREYRVVAGGALGPAKPCNFDELRKKIKAWDKMARTTKARK